MKYTITFVLLLFTIGMYAQVGIGTTTPEASAALDITSTDSGLLIPRMTTAQREAITATLTITEREAADGLQVYDTDTKSLWYYNGSAWVNSANNNNIYTANGILAGNRTVTMSGNYLNFTGGRVGIGTPSPQTLLDVQGSGSVGRPSNLWSPNINYFSASGTGANSIGGLYTSGAHRTSLVSNGYRNNSNQWTSNVINGFTGAASIDLDARGSILFGTEASKLTGDPSSLVTTRMLIDNVGNVGIGTTAPQVPLHVNGEIRSRTGTTGGFASLVAPIGGANSGFLAIHDSNGDRRGYIGWDNTDMTYVADNSSDHVFSGGNVGIGTAIPLSTLDVRGNARVGNGTDYTLIDIFGVTMTRGASYLRPSVDGTQDLHIGYDFGAGNALKWRNVYVEALDNFRVGTDGIDRLAINNAGNVGIGLLPAATGPKLDVNGGTRIRSIPNTGGTVTRILSSTGAGDIVSLDGDDIVSNSILASNGIYETTEPSGQTLLKLGGDLTENTNITSTSNFDLNIDSNTLVVDASLNRVGIGTTAPQVPLHVNGEIRSRTGLTGGFASLASGGGANSGFLAIHDSNGDRRGYIGWDNTDMTYVAQNSSDHVFSGGNVGILTNGPTQRLDVNGNARIRSLGAGSTGNDFVTADANGVLRRLASTSANTPNIYTENGVLTGARLLTTNNHRFTIASGVSEELLRMESNIIYFNTNSRNVDFNIRGDNDTSLFFADASTDNVGIGTTTPQAPLHVSGAIFSRTGINGGYAMLNPGGTANSGYLGIHASNGDRRGYIGFDNNHMRYQAENGSRHDFNGGDVLIQGGNDLYLRGITDAGQDGTRLLNSGGSTYLDNKGPGSIHFRTDDDPGGTGNDIRMSIDVDGNVGIGTIDPSQTLDVWGDISNRGAYFINSSDGNFAGTILTTGEAGTANSVLIRANRGNGNIVFQTNDGGLVEKMRIASNGNVGIGTTIPEERLDVRGNVLVNGRLYLDIFSKKEYITVIGGNGAAGASGSFNIYTNNQNRAEFSNRSGSLYMLYAGGNTITFPSDIRIKKEINKINDSFLEHINSINVVNYRYKKDANNEYDKEVGVIAQDVEKHYPFLVTESEEVDPEYGIKVKTVAYPNLGLVAIKAIQELKEKVEKLEAKNVALQAKNQSLESLVLEVQAKTQSMESLVSQMQALKAKVEGIEAQNSQEASPAALMAEKE